MSSLLRAITGFPLLCLGLLVASAGDCRGEEDDQLNLDFEQVVAPFLESYCTGCHGGDKPQGKFDLSPYDSLNSVIDDFGHWVLVLDRLRAGEMPPEDAKNQPDQEQKQRVIGWIERLRRAEATRHAGDPGPVLARRLSNAEYDYSILDLTGIEIRPTREFPVDPANEAGFDNTGESLAMSPALLTKYLAAAQLVADHLLLLPDSLDFAPHPIVTYSDRDKFAVKRIVDFYKQQPIDYGDYFFVTWRYRHRAKLDSPETTLDDLAAREGISAKYLKLVWDTLSDSETAVGPLALLQEQWNRLPEPAGNPVRNLQMVRHECEQLGELVIRTREGLGLPQGNFRVNVLNPSCQPIILWMNRGIAANRQLGLLPPADGTAETEQLRDAIATFCHVFPDQFFVSERGRMFLDPKQQNKGRLLSAGFHLMVGYFRDDAPLYELVLDTQQQQQLDRMWRELDFITLAPLRQFSDFVYFERAESPGFLRAKEFAFAREDTDITSESKMRRLAKLYLEAARSAGLEERILEVIAGYFDDMSSQIRELERQVFAAEPSHLQGLLMLAEQAWQRPLSETDGQQLIEFYHSLREHEGLGHEDALRDTLVSVLMSPRFLYRTTEAQPGTVTQPLSNDELASRLSYFLWSGLPDQALRELAANGELAKPQVLLEQTRRMLRDDRVRRLATEFGGHWLDFRQFETHNGVNRDRFPEFSDELRLAMYQEPIVFITDLIQRNGSVLELIEARHTFVNSVLAEHYELPFPAGDPNRWVRIDDADRVGRGGLLPMSVFLTQNSPGLRTSPVKRGYWVVRRLLGETIPPPPPEVPELPADEAKLGELSLREVLAKHRETRSCAVCHDRFDAIGLVYEGYGPVGERREVDLGGHPVDTTAQFPDGSEGRGVEGLRRYVLENRRDDLIDNVCRKLLSYALGRSLLLSDEFTIESMKERLVTNDYRFDSLVETIVSSPQFLQKRGRDFAGSSPAAIAPIEKTKE